MPKMTEDVIKKHQAIFDKVVAHAEEKNISNTKAARDLGIVNKFTYSSKYLNDRKKKNKAKFGKRKYTKRANNTQMFTMPLTDDKETTTTTASRAFMYVGTPQQLAEIAKNMGA